MNVYYLESFRLEAQQYGQIEAISELVDKWSQEKSGKTEQSLRERLLKPSRWCSFTIGKDFSAIAEVRGLGKSPWVIWVWLFPNRDPQGIQFLGLPLEHEAKLLALVKDEATKIQKWIDSQQGSMALTAPELPTSLQPFLKPPRLHEDDTQSAIFYETQTWAESFMESEIKKDWTFYHQLLYAILDPSSLLLQEESLERLLSGAVLIKYPGENFCILYVKVWERKQPRYVLIKPYRSRPDTSNVESQLKDIDPGIEQFNRAQTDQERTDALARFSRRCYSELMLYDRNLWWKIVDEANLEANLALSAEEMSLLNRISSPSSNGLPLPLIVNGQAGSGKSVMLAYIFASYCQVALKHIKKDGDENAPGGRVPLLFTTLNERLLDQAKSRVFLS